jgi:hypothetical protein
MPKKKEKHGIVTFLTIVIVIAVILVFYSFFIKKPAVVVSCEEGKILGFGTTSMPLMCMACIPDCEAEINVFDKDENIVCSNIYREDNKVRVPCEELKNHKNTELKIIYKINSSYGYFEGEEVLMYER